MSLDYRRANVFSFPKYHSATRWSFRLQTPYIQFHAYVCVGSGQLWKRFVFGPAHTFDDECCSRSAHALSIFRSRYDPSGCRKRTFSTNLKHIRYRPRRDLTQKHFHVGCHSLTWNHFEFVIYYGPSVYVLRTY